MRIAILGPGGVGVLLAGALERTGTPVTLVAREETADAITRDGVRVRSVALDAEWTARPRAVAELSEPVDVLIVATKATGLEAALERIATDVGLVVPLLNGLDHVARLRERFPAVLAATIRVESTRRAPGVVEQASPAIRVELAAAPAGVAALAAGLAERLRAAGITVLEGGAEVDVMWSKLSRLNALALATTAFDAPIGDVRADPAAARMLRGCVAETAAVARAEGAAVDTDTVQAEVDAMHPGLVSSMARDVAAGREPELDAIAGAVLRAAARHGIDAPHVAELTARVRARARAT